MRDKDKKEIHSSTIYEVRFESNDHVHVERVTLWDKPIVIGGLIKKGYNLITPQQDDIIAAAYRSLSPDGDNIKLPIEDYQISIKSPCSSFLSSKKEEDNS